MMELGWMGIWSWIVGIGDKVFFYGGTINKLLLCYTN